MHIELDPAALPALLEALHTGALEPWSPDGCARVYELRAHLCTTPRLQSRLLPLLSEEAPRERRGSGMG